MFGFLDGLFDPTGFPPRWRCGVWSDGLGWTHILSDLAIFGAYIAIPCVLGRFLLKRRDVPFLPVFWLFSAFILSCGIGHLVEATIFWHPWYRLSALIKACTAVISLATVIALVPTLRRALIIATPAQLERINRTLQSEIEEHRKTQRNLESMNQRLTQEMEQREAAESKLRIAQKLEAVGQLAAGIAHEINTPIQYVSDNIRFLQVAFGDLAGMHAARENRSGVATDEPPSPRQHLKESTKAGNQPDWEYLAEEIPKAIEQSLEGVERVSRIVMAMKEFSHPGSCEKVATDIHRAIETTLTVAHNEYKYVATVTREYDESLPSIPILPGEFNQVILNLIINAAHAIGEAKLAPGTLGEIGIKTRCLGKLAEIRISDTGTGISEAVRGRVFDPFFTTKDVGKGSGQGLAIAHAVIVKQHGGTLTFDTVVGKGTTFIIQIPIFA